MSENEVTTTAKETGIVVSHAHWDREWRYTLWNSRMDLVELMDEIIEVLDSGAYPSYLLDGQSVVVEDYLEVRPEMTEKVKRFVREGKLFVGPWYTCPDTHPVDAECFVRNLLKGRRLSESYGGVFNYGYTSFGWGLPAQFPQLLAGFGIDFALSSKYIQPSRTVNQEYLWRSPDGTEMLFTRLGTLGRNAFYFSFHLDAVTGKSYNGKDWEYLPSDGRTPYREADDFYVDQDHILLEDFDHFHQDKVTRAALDLSWEWNEGTLVTDKRLMMNGTDSSAPQKLLPKMIEELNKIDPNRQLVQGSFPDWAEHLKANIDRSKLVTVEGELRDGPAPNTSGNALPTRLYLKQLNKKVQNHLIRFAEPFNAMAWTLGIEYPKTMFGLAWKYLLRSHCHDSINGVGQDKISSDTKNRLEQALDLAHTMSKHAMSQLIRRIDLGAMEPAQIALVAFNPAAGEREMVAHAFVDLPWNDDVYDFELEDMDGNRYAVQTLFKKKWNAPVVNNHHRPFPYPVERHEVVFETGTLPACGYKVFKIVPNTFDRATMAWPPNVVHSELIAESTTRMENEFLAVTMNPNGTFDLDDKERGVTYRGLNYFEDKGEIGDYWVRRDPLDNQTHNSLGSQARMWLKENGKLQATLAAEVAMTLPARAVRDESRRSPEMKTMTLRSEITLRKGARDVEVNVFFTNEIEDHKLRVMFPTGLTEATHTDAGGHFHVDHRPILRKIIGEESKWYENAQPQPHQSFVDLSDGKRGLAFLNDCLTEYEVLRDRERTMALALLRSVRMEICDENRVFSIYPEQKGSQCFGDHHLRYVIRPHAGDWADAGLPRLAEQLNSPVRIIQTSGHKGDLPAGGVSFFKVGDDRLRLAAIKRGEDRDSVIVRVYNPTGETIDTALTLFSKPKAAWLTTLNEEREGELTVAADGSVAVSVPRGKILTVELEFANVGK